MVYQQRWIFHRKRTIELDDIDTNCYLLCKERGQHMVETFLWLNIFFLDEYHTIVYFIWFQYECYFAIKKDKYHSKRVMVDVLYILKKQKKNFLGQLDVSILVK